AASTVEVLVDAPRADCRTLQRRHHEARIAATWQVLGLRDDATRAAPGVERAVVELVEQAHRLAGLLAAARRLLQLAGDLAFEALVACEPEYEVHAVVLAPRHDLFAAEARVGAHEDLDVRPLLSNVRHDALELVDRAGRRVDVGLAQSSAQ